MTQNNAAHMLVCLMISQRRERWKVGEYFPYVTASLGYSCKN